jgi:hypothetical protein
MRWAAAVWWSEYGGLKMTIQVGPCGLSQNRNSRLRASVDLFTTMVPKPFT